MSSLFLNTIIPTFGVVLSTIQFSVPFATLLECRKQGTIGPLNPVPWVSVWINCFGWMIYGVVIQDMYIMLSVVLGVLMNFYATTTALTLLGAHNEFKKAKEVEMVGIVGLSVWLIVGMLVGTGAVADAAAQSLAGTVVLSFGVLYYISPISSARQIIKEWDASSLSFPMILLNSISNAVWSVYGLVIDDFFVYGLSLFAFFVSLGFLCVKLILPSSAEKKDKEDKNVPAFERKATNMDSDTHFIVGTVLTQNEGGALIDQPVRIAINAQTLQQITTENAAAMGGQTPTVARSRAGSNAVPVNFGFQPSAPMQDPYLGSTGPAADPNAGAGVITRISRATTITDAVHELMETIVPKVKFDPLQLLLADGGAGGATFYAGDIEDGNVGRSLPLLPRRKTNDLYDPTGDTLKQAADRLSIIQEHDDSRRSSMSEAELTVETVKKKNDSSNADNSSSSSGGGKSGGGLASMFSKKGKTKNKGVDDDGYGSSTLTDSLL